MIHFSKGIQKLFVLMFCFGLLACTEGFQAGTTPVSTADQASTGAPAPTAPNSPFTPTAPPAVTPTPTPTPAPSGGGSSNTTDPYANARKICVDQTNQLRLKVLGAGYALRDRDAEKGSCSDTESKITMEQRSADNRPVPWHPAWGYCGETGQNSCGGGGSGYPLDTLMADCVSGWFDEGPGGAHYEQLMDTNAKSVSCGVYVSSGKMQIIQSLYYD
jgi:hypothetical protein